MFLCVLFYRCFFALFTKTKTGRKKNRLSKITMQTYKSLRRIQTHELPIFFFFCFINLYKGIQRLILFSCSNILLVNKPNSYIKKIHPRLPINIYHYNIILFTHKNLKHLSSTSLPLPLHTMSKVPANTFLLLRLAACTFSMHALEQSTTFFYRRNSILLEHQLD